MYDTTGGNSPRFPVGEGGKEMLSHMSEHHTPITNMAISLLEVQPNDTVLDIGCGGGRALQRISKIVTTGSLVGVDYSETAVACAAEENADDVASGKMKIVQGSVSELPFAENTFDKVYSIESYFFWPDLQEDVKEILRVLKPGGKAVLAGCLVPQRDYTEEIEARFAAMKIHLISAEDFALLLQDAGFRDVRVQVKPSDEEPYLHLCAIGWK